MAVGRCVRGTDARTGTGEWSRPIVAIATFAASLAACGGTIHEGPVRLPVAEAAVTTGPAPRSAGEAMPAELSALPLIAADGLAYLGAFRFPRLADTGDGCDGFAYGGRGLAFRPDGQSGAGSLIAVGHNHCGRIGEFSVPTPARGATLDALPRATLSSPAPGGRLIDPLEGALASSGISGGMHTTVNGLLVAKDHLIVSAGNGYGETQPVSHWRRPLDLARTGAVSAASAVVGPAPYDEARYTAGYMCHVPPALQTALGGPAITGWVADSIVSRTSNGPAAFAFDPARVGTARTVRAVPLVFYPHTDPLERSVSGRSQAVWNWTSTPRGCALPDGTRSLLFIGRHGIGTFEYGVGGPDGYTTDGPRRPIHDPADHATGEHAWPYRYQVWAYDALDLARVRAGSLRPGQVRPYATWRLSLPFELAGDDHATEGVAYDPRLRRLYLVQGGAGEFGEAIVHAFEVTQAVAPR